MNQSVWTDSVGLPEFPQLNGDRRTDVLIIGGGMCGILCAHFLQQAGVDYILAEGSRIAGGITKNTTAKISLQHGLNYHKLVKEKGTELAQMYLEANRDALLEYEHLSQNYPCDFEIKDSFIYAVSDKEILDKEMQALRLLGIHAELEEDIPIPVKTAGAVKIENQAQFHPLKFIAGIVPGLNIYEETFVQEVRGRMAVYQRGKIIADKIIVASHFPFINTHGSYFLKMYQHRSYVIALKGAEEVQGMYLDESGKGMSFRNYKDLLLLGGGAHRTGKSGGNWQELRTFAKEHYKDAKECYAWAAQDCMTLDGVPYIGHYSKRTPALYVATGFQKWGMTTSMAAAKLLCNMILDRQTAYREVFSPRRSMIKSQLLVNGWEASVNLLTPTAKRCSHLGCALKWNKTEHTWDCPCHGSRFEESGLLINNPAMHSARVKR